MKATREDCDECKAYGHAWTPSAPNPYFDRVSDRCLFSDCTRCGSSKADDIDLDGTPYRTHYYYSADYRSYLDTGPERKTARNTLYNRTQKRTRRLRSVPA